MFLFPRLVLAAFLVLLIHTGWAATDLKILEQELSDSVITTKITAKFTKNKNLNPLKISVKTKNGVVKLHGHVKDTAAFFEALTLAEATKGVRIVDTDELEIKPVNTIFTDAYITAKVEAAVLKAKILDDESIPLVGINASTTNGIVVLSGSVKKSTFITAIIKRVNAIWGVKKIVSYLTVTKDSHPQ